MAQIVHNHQLNVRFREYYTIHNVFHRLIENSQQNIQEGLWKIVSNYLSYNYEFIYVVVGKQGRL